MAVTIAVVAVVTVGAWNTVDGTSSGAGTDVVSDVVDVQLTQIVTVGSLNAVRPVNSSVTCNIILSIQYTYHALCQVS